MEMARQVADFFQVDIEAPGFEQKLIALIESSKAKDFVPQSKSRRTGLPSPPHGPNDWRSPKKIVDAARWLLGAIDCDPCACATPASESIGEINYTAEQDGLAEANEWDGRVWVAPGHVGDMNPWITKALDQFTSGTLTSALLLLPESSLSVPKALLRFPIAVTTGPLIVSLPTGKDTVLPTRGLFVFVAKQPDLNRFRDAINDIGVVFGPLD